MPVLCIASANNKVWWVSQGPYLVAMIMIHIHIAYRQQHLFLSYNFWIFFSFVETSRCRYEQKVNNDIDL